MDLPRFLTAVILTLTYIMASTEFIKLLKSKIRHSQIFPHTLNTIAFVKNVHFMWVTIYLIKLQEIALYNVEHVLQSVKDYSRQIGTSYKLLLLIETDIAEMGRISEGSMNGDGDDDI